MRVFACMEPEELAEWQRLNGTLYPGQRAASPCVDCCKAYATAMRAEGRCDGVPGPTKRPPVNPTYLAKLKLAWLASAKARTARKAERRVEARRLRALGLSYADIGAAMGVSESSAWDYVKRAA